MLLLALLLGGLGVYLARQYIEEEIAFYRAQLEKTEPMSEVVVAARALSPGDVLKQEDLALRQIPHQYTDSHSVQAGNYDRALGQRVAFEVDEGRALLWAHLEGGMTPTFSGKVEAGKRAMTVRVDEVNAISGFLQPGDKVDLLLSVSGSRADARIVPLIEQMTVIATGVQTSVDRTGAMGKRSFTTITVHVSPLDAKRLTLAQSVGKLTATLRNPDDNSPLDSEPMTVAELLAIAEPPAPAPVVAPQPGPRRTTEPPAIEYIIGGSS